MEAPLEIRYAGVVIGRAQELRGAEGDAPSFFIPVRDPMPVGTVLHLRAGDRETPVRVVRTVETTDATACGMQVRTIGESEVVARDFIPPPAVAGEKIKLATPTPVVEVDVAKMQAESATPAAAEKQPDAAALAEGLTPEVVIIVEATPEVKLVASEPEGKVADAAPEAPAGGTSSEIAAVPEAVPVAIGSSMTGALKSATESVSIGEPAPAEPAKASASAIAPASPSPDLAKSENGAVAEVAPEAQGSVAEASGESAATDLPPARPIAGPSGRRKTKRRR